MYSVQSELVIQELQVATCAKQCVRTVPNLDRRVVFGRTEPAGFVMWSLPMCWCSSKKETKVIMLLGPVNKLMCTKSFRRNRSKLVTGFEIPGEWGIYCSFPVQALPSLLCCSSNADCCKEAALSSFIKSLFLPEGSSLQLNGKSFDSCFLGQGLAYSSCPQLLSSLQRKDTL